MPDRTDPEETRRFPQPGPPPATADAGAEAALPVVSAGRRLLHRLLRGLAGLGRAVATLALVAIAAIVALAAWQHYVYAPWTRNGAVRVQVAGIAPQVSGQIAELLVVDNQPVRKGDTLYVIDPFDFDTAVRQARANADQMAAALKVKQAEAARRQRLTVAAVSVEEKQIYQTSAEEARSALEAAQQALAQAQMDLARTTVTSPVDGYVTNLLLRVGDYAVKGQSNVSVIDATSFWIDGYFEETKLSQICIGDRAEAVLLGYDAPITGRVETLTRGISVGNAAPGIQGLPAVNPVYTWVRLAQRVPVRIAIENVPPGVPLVSGMTATVTVRPAATGAPSPGDGSPPDLSLADLSLADLSLAGLPLDAPALWHSVLAGLDLLRGRAPAARDCPAAAGLPAAARPQGG